MMKIDRALLYIAMANLALNSNRGRPRIRSDPERHVKTSTNASTRATGTRGVARPGRATRQSILVHGTSFNERDKSGRGAWDSGAELNGVKAMRQAGLGDGTTFDEDTCRRAGARTTGARLDLRECHGVGHASAMRHRGSFSCRERCSASGLGRRRMSARIDGRLPIAHKLGWTRPIKGEQVGVSQSGEVAVAK